MSIKGIKRVNHIAISVPDLEEAIAFYCGALGLPLVDRWDFEENESVDGVLALKDASAKTVMIAAGNIFLEIFEFTNPTPKTQDAQRPVCDHGYTHFAFEVEDIHTVYAELEKAGMQWHHPLQDDLEEDGSIIMTYGRDPFGNVIEIQQTTPEMKLNTNNLQHYRL